jgi:hypothetical protein
LHLIVDKSVYRSLTPKKAKGKAHSCAIAFHEKAGRSQVGSIVFSLDKVFSCRVSHCRHPSIRTLRERFAPGASWVFSFQPVLPPVWRPRFHLEDESWARRLTQSPELGVGFFAFPS